MSATYTLSNGDSRQYWEGTREGRLRLQRCKTCQTVQFPPRHHCASCWDAELDWIDASGKGRVESFTVVRRAPAAAFRDKVPYVVAAVLLEEGPRMITNLVGDHVLNVGIGDEVQVEFAEGADNVTLPLFRLA